MFMEADKKDNAEMYNLVAPIQLMRKAGLEQC